MARLLRHCSHYYLTLRGLMKYITLLSLLMTQNAFSQEQQDESELDLLFGLNGGALLSFSENTEFESNKVGYLVNGTLHVLYETYHLGFRMGGGWGQYNLQGNVARSVKEPGKEDKAKILTHVGHAEVAALIKTESGFQIGPISQVFLGTDSSFSPFDEENIPRVFLGMAASYPVQKDSFNVYVDTQVVTDINIDNRQILAFSIGLKVGLPELPKKVVKIQKKETKKFVTVKKEDIVEKVVPEYRYILEPQIFHFVTDYYVPSEKAMEALWEMGAFLGEKKDKWQMIEVAGHTDYRGGEAYNIVLSQNRARTVETLLVDSGVPRDKIYSKGYSFSQEVDKNNTSIGLARNRRVEIVFKNVKNPDEIAEKLDSIKEKYFGK